MLVIVGNKIIKKKREKEKRWKMSAMSTFDIGAKRFMLLITRFVCDCDVSDNGLYSLAMYMARCWGQEKKKKENIPYLCT